MKPWAFAGKYPSPAAAGIKTGKAAKLDPPGSPGIKLHHSLSPVESRPCQWNHHTLFPPPALSSAEFHGSRLSEDLFLHLGDPGGLAVPAMPVPQCTGKYILIPCTTNTSTHTHALLHHLSSSGHVQPDWQRRRVDNRNITVLSPNSAARGSGLSAACLLPKPSNHHGLSITQGRDELESAVVTPLSAGYIYLGTDLDWDFRCNPRSSSFDAAFKMCSSKDQSLIIPTAYHPRRSGETKGISSMFRACPGCTETCKDQVVFPPQYALINREATIITQCRPMLKSPWPKHLGL